MIDQITKHFDDFLRERLKTKPEIMNYVLKHERKSLCIQNLCAEIIRTEKYRINVSVETYKSLIQGVAGIFANATIEHLEQKHYTQAKIRQLQQERDRIKDAQEMLQDLEKDAVNEKGLTQIERDEIKKEIEIRQAGTAD
jgi:hypothetical protein